MDSKLPITFVDFYQVRKCRNVPPAPSRGLMDPPLTTPVAFQLFLQNVGVVAVAASVIPAMLVPILPLLLFFLYLRRFYLSASRDVKRLEATSMLRPSFASLKNASVSDGWLLLTTVSFLPVLCRSPESHLLSSVLVSSGFVDHPSLRCTGETEACL